MDRLDFHIDWYNKELDRINTLNDAINIPVGLLTGMLALYAFMLNEYNYVDGYTGFISIWFHLGLSASVFSWLKVLFHLSKSYNNHSKGYSYKYIPSALSLDDHFESLVKYVEVNKEDLEVEVSADTLYKHDLLNLLVYAVDTNYINNSKKSSQLFLAKRWLLYCIVLIIISIVPFSINYMQYKKENKIQDISIVNFKDLKPILNPLIKHIIMAKEKKTPPPPPKPPQLRTVKQGDQVRTTKEEIKRLEKK